MIKSNNQQDQDVGSLLIMSDSNFYRKLYQTKLRGHDAKKYQIFGVPIGNEKKNKKSTVQPSGTSDKI